MSWLSLILSKKLREEINGGLNGIDERCKLYRALMVTDND